MLVPPLPENEIQRLHALYRHCLLDTLAEERFDRLTRLAQQLFAVPIVAISLVDEKRQWFKSHQGINVCETARDISFCTHTILSPDICEVPDAQLDYRFVDNPLVTAAPFIRFYAGAPLITPDGFRIGTLCLIDTQPRQLTDKQRQALRDLANCVQAEIAKTDQAKLQNDHITEPIQISHQTLVAILDNIPNMVFLKRASDLRFEYFNRAGEILLGVKREALLGKNDYDFFPVEQADFFTEKDRQVLSQYQVVDIPEENIETPHGTRLLHTRKLALRDIFGKAQYLLGISEDITERTRTEQLKSEFVSIVSHELRTPLTSIAGSLGLLAGGVLGNLPAQAKQMLDIAYKNTNRLSFLINDLLDMEKLSAGKMHFEFRTQELLPMVEYAIRDNQTYANQCHVKFLLDNQTKDVWVNVDSHRMHQVLANLLSNAAKFSPEGETVTISLAQLDQLVRVSVHDCGAGIPKEFRERIFQKFSQADSSDTRQKGGTGLGLAISRELIQRMNGHIDFISEPGLGSTFYFELPVCDNNTR